MSIIYLFPLTGTDLYKKCKEYNLINIVRKYLANVFLFYCAHA